MTNLTPSHSQRPFKPGAVRRVAENLLIARLLRNWPQEDLAEAAGIDRSYVGGIARGDRNVSLDNLEKLTHALGMTIADLTSEPDPQRVAEKILELVSTSGVFHNQSWKTSPWLM